MDADTKAKDVMEPLMKDEDAAKEADETKSDTVSSCELEQWVESKILNRQ